MKGTASDFFRNALLFLSYTSLDDISAEKQLSLASDLALAALAGEDIYNFGELVGRVAIFVVMNSIVIPIHCRHTAGARNCQDIGWIKVRLALEVIAAF